MLSKHAEFMDHIIPWLAAHTPAMRIYIRFWCKTRSDWTDIADAEKWLNIAKKLPGRRWHVTALIRRKEPAEFVTQIKQITRQFNDGWVGKSHIHTAKTPYGSWQRTEAHVMSFQT